VRRVANKKTNSSKRNTKKRYNPIFLSKRDSSTSGTGPLLRKGTLFTTNRQANNAARTALQMFAHSLLKSPWSDALV